ncbi:RHS repeat-associated protein [Microbacteriaceae bacterium SG_E_30_P1]|uniref:RHS repeat-associated protein n=1 Tax=Antiquaquibacter oligotrophicus TaxID=2880260 RepID=A0ABT6KKM3_9MICO|nr:RHS repeat-associated core domain-containing protein [Antiquaquibacter oligotrophicus]MDH6180409.1 RHS repeat-associated protein [Antiquaquibacter oligotrophicus]UDF13851.1 hypothetical protein LH407_03060 [Antiquaquibacter oligotrophicus]
MQNLTQAWTAGYPYCYATPTPTTLGSAAPYWKSWSVDPVTGNREELIDHYSGGAGVDTVDTYSYPTTGDQPHTLTGISTSVDGGAPTAQAFTYDESGNLVESDNLSLTWDAQNRLEKIETDTSEEQDNVYSASGGLLLRQDSVEGTTLYLGSTELNIPAGSSTVSALRTYSIAGQTVAEREATAGVSGFTLRWLSMDVVGTSKVSIDATTGAATRRHTDPFGVSTNPSSFSTPWPSSHGYLNAPESDTTGLTRLGAREYDPARGRFISVDPVLAPMNPQQNNGYSYAANNPVANADASGLCYTPMDKKACDHYTDSWKKYHESLKGGGGDGGGGGSDAPGSPGNGSGGGEGGGEPQWWNPFTWSGDTWQDVGAMAAGIAVTIALTAAVVGAVGCTAVTFGVCGAVIIGVGIAAGAAGAAVTYGLQVARRAPKASARRYWEVPSEEPYPASAAHWARFYRLWRNSSMDS